MEADGRIAGSQPSEDQSSCPAANPNGERKEHFMRLSRRKREDQGALTPYGWGAQTPFQELNRIRHEINQIFGDPLGLLAPSTSFFESGEPMIDVYEDKDKITVKAEVPGMKKEEIDVSLQGNTLTIAGERKREEEQKTVESYRSERYFGRFQRSITLPAPVDANKIQATYKEGVLTVNLPKAEEAKPKQVPIKAT
jgi:HSP20 family protein